MRKELFFDAPYSHQTLRNMVAEILMLTVARRDIAVSRTART